MFQQLCILATELIVQPTVNVCAENPFVLELFSNDLVEIGDIA